MLATLEVSPFIEWDSVEVLAYGKGEGDCIQITLTDRGQGWPVYTNIMIHYGNMSKYAKFVEKLKREVANLPDGLPGRERGKDGIYD